MNRKLARAVRAIGKKRQEIADADASAELEKVNRQKFFDTDAEANAFRDGVQFVNDSAVEVRFISARGKRFCVQMWDEDLNIQQVEDANGDTVLGFAEWVEHQMEADSL